MEKFLVELGLVTVCVLASVFGFANVLGFVWLVSGRFSMLLSALFYVSRRDH